MGDVWKAEDLKLGRQVALKFLASHLVSDPEIHKRFQREAKASAALSHPNICHVYEIDEADGKSFLAMELVKGQSLEARIDQGPLPLPDALDLTRQIAEGLQEAHSAGVVHRDIKPANILVTPDGRAKILDFGLALLTEGSKLTKLDTTVGTVAYMSPEQGQGADVDHRTDIWALGVVLYEIVSGQRPFKGQYDQALLYEIVQEEPEPLTAVRTGVPMELELLVSKGLAKEASRRYQSASEMVVDLETLGDKLKSSRSTILRGPGLSQPMAPQPASGEPIGRAQRQKQTIAYSVGALGVLLALAFAFFPLFSPPPAAEAPLRRFSFTPESFFRGSFGRVKISPNGKHIVYLRGGEEPKLLVQDIDREQPRELGGTEGARDKGLFWSPDSQFIGFAAGSALKRVSVQGGPAITLCQLTGATWEGGAWSPDGSSIVFSSPLAGSSGPVLQEIPAQGGSPRLLFEPDTSESGSGNAQPYFLPSQSGARSIVYDVGNLTNREIFVKNLETGERKVLAQGAFPVYSPTGHILYQTGAFSPGLWALPFSLETLKPTGEAIPIAENAAEPSLAVDGTLVYVDLLGGRQRQLVWQDRDGKELEVISQPQATMEQPSLSPDGRRAAVVSNERGSLDIWVHDLTRSTKTRLTFEDKVVGSPTWSPSGQEIAYHRDGGPAGHIVRRAADGTGEAFVLVESDAEGVLYPDWSRDGRYLVYYERNVETQRDIRYIEFRSDGDAVESATFLGSPANERHPKLSPDGRFLAYTSDESGRDEIYVRPFPGGEGKWQASTNGGTQPRWRGDGRELYYSETGTIMAVAVSIEGAFALGRPQRLFVTPGLTSTTGSWNYDVSADGQRFLTIAPVEEADTTPPKIRVVENWYEEFRDR